MDKIKQFDPKTIKLPTSMVLIGKSKSGKTEQVHRIIDAIRPQINEIYLFSETGMINRSEFPYIPVRNIKEHLDLEFISDILERQKKIKMADKSNIKEIVFLLDDIIGDTSMRKPQILNLFTLGRHYNITTILLSQVAKGVLTTTIRNNTNYIISFFQHNQDRRADFVKEFMSIKSKTEGEDIYKKITSTPYTSIVINLLNTTSRDYDGYLFKYKIDTRKKVKKTVMEPKAPQISQKVFTDNRGVPYDFNIRTKI